MGSMIRAPKFSEGYEMSQTVQAMIERLEAESHDTPPLPDSSYTTLT